MSKYGEDKFKIVGNVGNNPSFTARKGIGYWDDVWNHLKKNKGAMFGAIVIVIFTLLAVFVPMLSPYEYDEQNLQAANLPPKVPCLENFSFLHLDGMVPEETDAHGVTTPPYDAYMIEDEETGEMVPYENYHYFGTDDLGRDIWTRVWMGARVSLLIALIAVTFDLLIGVAYGMISGYFGGRVDLVMQRILELLYGIPYLIVVMLFLVIFESPGVFTIALALSITGWTGMARVVRAQVLKLKNEEYLLAAKTLGASDTRIITKHLLPNMVGPIVVTAMFTIPTAIFAESFLSYIGLGISPPMASLGTLIQDGLSYMTVQPYKLFFPAAVLSLLILSFNLLADGLRDALDPKLREGR